MLNWSTSLQADEAVLLTAAHTQRWGTPEHQHTSGGKNPNPAEQGHHTPWTTCLSCHSLQADPGEHNSSSLESNFKLASIPASRDSSGLHLHSQGHSKEHPQLHCSATSSSSSAATALQGQRCPGGQDLGGRPSRAPALLTATAGRCGAPWVSNRVWSLLQSHTRVTAAFLEGGSLTAKLQSISLSCQQREALCIWKRGFKLKAGKGFLFPEILHDGQ